MTCTNSAAIVSAREGWSQRQGLGNESITHSNKKGATQNCSRLWGIEASDTKEKVNKA